MAGSGLPLLAMLAWKDCSAPSSTEEETGRKRDGDVAGDGDAGDRGLGGVGVTGGGHLYFAAGGRSAGAVKIPSAEMVPT